MISKIPGNQQANIAINNLGLQASDMLKKKFMKEVIRKGGSCLPPTLLGQSQQSQGRLLPVCNNSCPAAIVERGG